MQVRSVRRHVCRDLRAAMENTGEQIVYGYAVRVCGTTMCGSDSAGGALRFSRGSKHKGPKQTIYLRLEGEPRRIWPVLAIKMRLVVKMQRLCRLDLRQTTCKVHKDKYVRRIRWQNTKCSLACTFNILVKKFIGQQPQHSNSLHQQILAITAKHITP